MRLILIDGTRGTGKSTLASKLRQRQSDTTLVNFTGFHSDGEEGLRKVTDYYTYWLTFLYSMKQHNSSFVCDRFFFSEQVYTPLYKEYDFSKKYNMFADFLPKVSDEIHIFHLTIHDEEELKGRLTRDKVPFGKAEENAQQSFLQQERYLELFAELRERYSNLDHVRIHTIATDSKTNDEVYDELIQKIEEGS
jgi:thymidylate kinase